MEDVLGALRVTGNVLLCEEYVAPWGIAVPTARVLTDMLTATADAHVVPFHLVRHGAFELRGRGLRKAVVREGELVIVTRGDAHTLSEGGSPKMVPLHEALSKPPRHRSRPTRCTGLLCGVFTMRNVGHNPLFNALPPVLHVRVRGAEASTSAHAIAGLLIREVAAAPRGRGWVIARLLELLLAEAIASHRGEAPSWVLATRDPAIGRALDAFHRSPGFRWTVPQLAREAALSASRFSARFRELLGAAPMAYVTRWRMNVAARRLSGEGGTVQGVAGALGYETVAAFSRAYKRVWGVSPSKHRQRPT